MLRGRFIKSANYRRIHRGAGLIMWSALLLITLVTTIGAVSITTSATELKATKNSHRYMAGFYMAESGWREGAMWLEQMAGPPLIQNKRTNLVRKYGDGDPVDSRNYFKEKTEGSEISKVDGIAYKCEIEYLRNRVHPGSGKSYRRFLYRISSKADQGQEIDVALSKLYKVGY